MLYNKGNHAKFKCVQPQPSPLQDENGGKIHQTWNFGVWRFIPSTVADRIPEQYTHPLLMARLGTAVFAYNSELNDTCPVSYTHLRAHETPEHLVCRLLLEKKKQTLQH